MGRAASLALKDLHNGFLQWRTWSSLGWGDIKQRYRRSVIGPFWITMSLAIFVGALGILYSRMFKIDVNQYMPYLTIGYLMWSFISVLMVEGCIVFIEAESILKQLRIPLSLFVFRMVWRNTLVFLHSLPILVVVFAIFNVRPSWGMLLAIPGFALVCINGVWAALLLGILCTRFRDIQAIVQNLLQVVFFVTPIFWFPDMLPGHAILFEANIVYNFIEIVRGPVIGKMPSPTNYLVVLLTTGVGWTLSMLLFQRFRHRVTYWL